jgi:pyridinium-3,5-bisthiocarboxylic acid mononucleotide nickel chelatase
VVLGDADAERQTMTVLEANVDDLDPRLWPTVLDALLAAGAADAWLAPIVMKKGRPAHVLSVLARPADVPALRDLVFALTSTIGLRATPVARWALDRGWVDVVVAGRSVAVKVAHRDRVVVHATPEFEDVRAAAAALGRPAREVLEAAVAAAVAAGLVDGAAVPSDLRPQV